MSEIHDLSNIKYTGGKKHQVDVIGILVSKWNPEITNALYDGARSTLLEAGVKAKYILRLDVPGSFELPSAAHMVLSSTNYKLDAMICIGCVIQGETRHFDFINQAVAIGVIKVSLKFNTPVIYGVLTPENMEQAKDRAGGKLGNKGCEAAVAALEMIDLKRSLRNRV